MYIIKPAVMQSHTDFAAVLGGPPGAVAGSGVEETKREK